MMADHRPRENWTVEIEAESEERRSATGWVSGNFMAGRRAERRAEQSRAEGGREKETEVRGGGK